MSFNWSKYSLAELKQHATTIYRQGGGSRPDVLLIEIDDNKAVLKDSNSTDRWFRLIIGPLLAWRECKALTKLAHLDGIPNLLSRPDSRSFLMTHYASEQITKLDDIKADWPDFFDKLPELISKMHNAGVAHNDLRNPSNILITENGEPILVDLVACFCQGHKWNIVNQWLFSKFCLVDLSAITKAKQQVSPDLITDDDISPDQIAGTFGLTARKFGQWIRTLSRKLFTSQ